MTIEADKAALREALALRRGAIAEPSHAARALAATFPVAIARRASAIAGYVRFRSEIDPLPLMAWLAAMGPMLLLPRTPPRGVRAGLTFHPWRPGEALMRSAFGVLEPAEGGPLEPDVILTPLLGFDRAGGRLGYGQGHYDRTLAALRARRPVIAVGLAFAAQEVPRVPMGPHDARLDWVVTEREAIACAP